MICSLPQDPSVLKAALLLLSPLSDDEMNGCILSGPRVLTGAWEGTRQQSLWFSGLDCLRSVGQQGVTCSFSCLVNHSDATARICDHVIIALFLMSQDTGTFWNKSSADL